MGYHSNQVMVDLEGRHPQLNRLPLTPNSPTAAISDGPWHRVSVTLHSSAHAESAYLPGNHVKPISTFAV